MTFYRERGFVGILRLLRRKLLPPVSYKGISKSVWSHLSAKNTAYQACNALGKGVKYVISHAVSELRVIKGWFRETVPLIPSETKFALVHIDSDLYESSIDALDGLLSRNIIAESAIIYFDDWNDNRANPEAGERLAWSEVVEKYQIRFSPVGAYGVDGYRLIIHSYIS